MVPLIARTTGEMLLLVPQELRDASYALGISRWRTIVGIVLPSALGGILTGVVLAVARAAGETAPMLILCSIFTNTTTIDLFGARDAEHPDDDLQRLRVGLSRRITRARGAPRSS